MSTEVESIHKYVVESGHQNVPIIDYRILYDLYTNVKAKLARKTAGRPKKYLTEEERRTARLQAMKNFRMKKKQPTE